RPGAAGEFRARASRAASQIEIGALGGVPVTLPTAFTGAISPAAPAARHFSSRPDAAGEFRARARRADSQIERPGTPVASGAFVRPTALITGFGVSMGVNFGSPQMRPT